MTIAQVMMARLYDRSMKNYELHAAPKRAALLGELGGHIVELGPGTGVNLPHVAEAARRGKIRYTGVEPSEPMAAKLRARAAADHPELGIAFAGLTEGRIDLEDECADTVICTLVLCSIPDQLATLREAQRILRPGGRFLFMEHVAAERGTGRRLVQNVLAPFWGIFADGCKLNRETWTSMESLGWSELELEHFDSMGMPWFGRPHILGVATK